MIREPGLWRRAGCILAGGHTRPNHPDLWLRGYRCRRCLHLFNNLTAAGAVVGFVLGFIGIWKSKPLMSGIAVFLCGTAVALTVYAQVQLTRELEDLQRDLDQIGTELEADLDTYNDCLDAYGDDTTGAMLNCGGE